MLHMGKNTPTCKTCVPLWGFKIAIIVVVGSIIGYFANDYTQQPFSTRLILDTNHNEKTNDIVTLLDSMANNIIIIKKDILHIKNNINNTTSNDSVEK